MKPILLSARQASQRSGISYSLLRGAIRSGRLPTVILCRRRLIPLAALERLLNEVEKLSATGATHWHT